MMLVRAKIPDEILNKRGPLTEQEYNIMKTHTVHGYQLTKNLLYHFCLENIRQDSIITPWSGMMAVVILLAIRKIKYPLWPGWLPIVDTYDAMTSDRVYRGQRPPFEVFALLKRTCKAMISY